jgi:RNA polymerase sigma-70 factor (ECF subfamily)
MTFAWVFQAAFADDGCDSESYRLRGTSDSDRSASRAPSVDRHATYVAQIRRGDAHAFDELYRTFYAPLVGFAVHYDGVTQAIAEEMIQETFLALWRAREAWEVRSTVREYLFGAVRNRVLDYLRHERIVRTVSERVGPEAIAGVAQNAEHPDTLIIAEELREAINTVLATMPAERRQVLILRWQEGFSYPEIASVLGISVNAAKQQGSRAQRALRRLLERFQP